jgi:hypothetical protein
MNKQAHQHITYSLLVLLLLIYGKAYTQRPAPSDHFRDVFERETQRKPDSYAFGNFKNIGYLSFFPDTLPQWFFKPPKNDLQRIYAIGISDPDLTRDEAFEQAIYRAKILAVLYNTSRVEFFRDVFTSTAEGDRYRGYRQRFDTYFRISASQMADSAQFIVIDQHLTRYNESVVLLSYTPAPINGTQFSRITAMASMLYVEAQVGNAFEQQSSYDLISEIQHSGRDTEKATFNATRKGNREQTTSFFLENEIHFPLFVYRYSNPDWKSFTKPMVSHSGLWGIYIRQMLEHITLTTEQNNMRLRSINQQSEPQATDLAREISAKVMRINLIELDFNPTGINFEITID